LCQHFWNSKFTRLECFRPTRVKQGVQSVLPAVQSAFPAKRKGWCEQVASSLQQTVVFRDWNGPHLP
jgi:hypothetical protein